MLKNNSLSLLYHGFIVVIFIIGGYLSWNSKDLSTSYFLNSLLVAFLLSFISGFILPSVRGMRNVWRSNIILIAIPLIALPILLTYDMVLQAVYFYYIYHLPMNIIYSFFPSLSAWPLFAVLLIPYVLATFGHTLRHLIFRSKKHRVALPLVLIVTIALSGCSQGGDLSSYWKIAAEERQLADAYELRILLIHGSDGFQSESIPQHFAQTLFAGSSVDAASLDELDPLQLNSYDLVYLDEGLKKQTEWELAKQQLIDYAANGGTLYLSHEYGEDFPAEVLGINGMKAVEDAELNFDYPAVRANLTGLQQTWASFSDLYDAYKGLDSKHHISFQQAAIPDTATTLVGRDGLAYLLVNEWGKGKVIWSNQFIAPEVFITRLDLSAEDGGKYFHYGWATANMLLRSELVNFVSKEKYGYSIKKAYGPYGRPGVAWQSHYEALYSFVLRDVIKWTELLQTYDQVPSYSLVRGSYNGGKWHETIRLLRNIGEDDKPDFEGVERDSFFSYGEILTTEQDALWFDAFPGYHTFLSPIAEPYRAYPAVVPEGIDSEYALIVGSADGSLYGISKNKPNSATIAEGASSITVSKTQLTIKGGKHQFANKYSAPTVINWSKERSADLLVGDGDGRVKLYIQQGNQYEDYGYVEADGEDISVSGPASVHAVDWNGDGVYDLLIGDSEGNVHLYTGHRETVGLSFTKEGKLAIQSGMTYAAPFATDWNNDGLLDLLIGGYEGEVRLFLRTDDGSLEDNGLLSGDYANFFGTNNIKVGHYSVPLVVDWDGDGKKDMLTGHLEYGNTYSIDSDKFPYQTELKETISYLQGKSLPIIPHMYLHEYMSDEQEQREMQAHKDAFNALGLPWDQDMGVNHHTWRINNDALQTFNNQKATGIWWNFGFNPPHVSSAPRDGKEFLMVMPFMLPGTEPSNLTQSDADRESGNKDLTVEPFLLFAPAPHAVSYSRAWQELAKYDIPLIQFEHIEHGMKPFTSIYNNLIRQIETIDTFRKANNYSAMTEDQIAMSLLNTFYADVNVQWSEEQLVVRVNDDAVPWQVKEYADTLGIRVELGEKYAGWKVNTSSSFAWEGNDAFYVGLNDAVTSLEWTQSSNEDDFIRIIHSNSPVAIIKDGTNVKLSLAAKGMQDLKLYSPIPLKIHGKDIRVTKEGNEYTIVHYGEKLELTLSAR